MSVFAESKYRAGTLSQYQKGLRMRNHATAATTFSPKPWSSYHTQSGSLVEMLQSKRDWIGEFLELRSSRPTKKGGNHARQRKIARTGFEGTSSGSSKD